MRILAHRTIVGQARFAIATVLLVFACITRGNAQNWLYSYDESGNQVVRLSSSNFPPQILKQPQPQIVAPGELASFSVVVSGTRALTYQWRFNTANLPGQTKDCLLLLNVSTNNQGSYDVVVTDSSGSVTSSPALLYTDSDDDGLPDSWELTYFGNLTSQRSGGDADGDGSLNLNEFFDGTNPTNNVSRNSRLTVLAEGGSVAATPTKLNYANGESVMLTATPFPPNAFYSWTGDLIARTNPAALTMNSNKTVTAHFRCEPSPPGTVGWWRAENDAIDALGSNNGALSNGLSFAQGQVGQAFLFNGANQEVKIPASPALNVGAGNGLTIEAWIKPANLGTEYELAEWNNGSTIGAHFAINVGFSGQGGPGSLYANLRDINGADHYFFSAPGLVSTAVWQHVAVTYDRNSGTAKLFLNGLTVASANLGNFVPRTLFDLHLGLRPGSVSYSGLLDELAIYNRALTPAEVFSIYLADAAGKCNDRPIFTSSPQLPDGLQGAAYAQQVTTVRGTLPMTFSLSAGSMPAGLTLSTSGLISGAPTSSGSNVFAVLATDAAGLSTELICGIRVLPSVTPVPAMPASLVAWWRAENNALDAVSTNHGTISNAVSFVAGEVGQAFLFSASNQTVRIPASPPLNIGAADGMTVEMWIKPASLAGEYELAEWNSGSTIGAHFAINVGFGGQGGPGCLYANLRDINGADHYFFSPAGLLSTSVWQHVAVTYERLSGTARLFFNGAAVATANLGNFVPRTTADLYLGFRPGYISYVGLLDEPAIYNRALTTNEVALLFNAGPLGKTSVGPYLNMLSPLPEAIVGTGYTQAIASVRGAAPVTYAVTSGGLPPGLNLNSSGLLSGTPTTIGSFNFTVRATDAAASSNSQTFALQVFARTPPLPGLVSWWRAESNALDSIGSNNGVLANGATFVSGKVGQAFFLDGVNDAITVADAPALRPASLTIEGWVLFNSADGIRVFFAKPVGNAFGDSFAVWLQNGNLLGVMNDAISPGPTVSIPFSPEVGQWYHVAYTFDDASKQQALYLNGAQVASGVANKTIAYDSHTMLLGRDEDLGNPAVHFYGRIDEAAFYNRALGSNEIATVYNSGPAGKTGSGPYFGTAPILPDAVSGIGYTQIIATLRGNLPVNVAVVGGALPPGLTLTPSGLLGGPPTTTGNFSFTIRATDNAGLTADQTFALRVLPKTPPPAGVIGWWRAEDNTLDAVGTSDGTLINGTTFAFGKVGQAFSLDGVDDIIEIPDSPGLRPASLTLETWVLFFSAAGSPHIIAKPLGSSTADSFVLWYESGSLRGLVSDISGGNSLISVPFTPVIGRWYHVAFTFDDNTKEQWLYLDGIAVATGNSNRKIGYDEHPVQLGGDIDVGNLANLLQGRIDEAAIYDRALGAAEITALYNAGSGGKTIVGPYFSTPPQLPAGALGRAYTQTLASVRGTPALSYTLAGGALPGGLMLSPSGTLSGAPNAIGAFNFIVRATDSAGLSGDAAFTLDVFAQVPPPAGLISWWRAENNGLDAAGSNHGLVTNGASYAPGKAGQAFLLDGVNDYIQVADGPSLRPASVTLEAWVLFNATGTRVLLSKPVGNFRSDSYQIYLSSGTLGAFVGDIAGAGSIVSVPFSPILGRWYHVAYTFDDETLQQVLYLDGITVAIGLGSKRIGYDAQPMLLGCDIEDGSRAFFLSGRIDEAAIYGRALRAEEIAALYGSGAAGKTTVGPYFTTAPSLPDGAVGRPYSQAINSARGASPITYSLVQGALPPGLTFSSGGLLNGTPSVGGDFTFVVRATDADGLFVEQFYTLEVFTPGPVPTGLLAWWKGDNNARDSAGTNHGTLQGGATFAAGKVIAAFDLNGTNAFVAISDSAWLNPAGAFSLEVWLKAGPQQFSADGQFLIVDKSHGFTDSTGWALQGNPNGTVSFFFGLGGVGVGNFIGPNTPGNLRDDHWHHLAGIFTGTQILLYQDGTLVGVTSNTNLPVGNSREVEIGRAWGGGSPTRYFHGLIDEISFYGRALSEAEVIAIYNAGPAGKGSVFFTPPLVLRPSQQGGLFVLSFDSIIRKSYDIQQSSNPSSGWTTFTNITATGTSVVVSNSIVNTQRFFRVRTTGN